MICSGARHTLTVPKVGDQLNNQQLAVVVSNDHGVDSCVVDLLTYRGIDFIIDVKKRSNKNNKR